VHGVLQQTLNSGGGLFFTFPRFLEKSKMANGFSYFHKNQELYQNPILTKIKKLILLIIFF